MKARIGFGLIVLAVLMAGVCYAGVTKEIRFPAGSTSGQVAGSVIRGERDVYSVTAKAGQIMKVSITAVEDNAAFAIYKPGATAAEKDGITEITGEALPKAGETDDAKTWKGTLPAPGKYLIVVGGTRGNASYKLKVVIR